MNNVKKLPDAYYKGEDGNNYKLLNLNEQAVEEFSNDLADVLTSLDIMQATGKTLDLYGKMVNQNRGVLDDDKYRILILNKIGKNLSNGNYDSVVELLAQMFDGSINDIKLEDSSSPCKVTIEQFPFVLLERSRLSGEQVVLIIEALLPACVTLTEINFDGTFEFCGNMTYGAMKKMTYGAMSSLTWEKLPTSDYDTSKGFAISHTNQTVGGYLGLAVSDSSDFELPI